MAQVEPIGGGGDGLGPAVLQVSPSGTLAFGTVAVGATKDITVTVTNIGDTGTVVSSVAIGGAPFSLIGLPAFPHSLGVANSFSFTLRYSPVASVTSNDTLVITASAGTDNSPYSAAVSGTGAGAAAALQVTPGPIAFADTITTHTTTVAVTVKNVGGASVQLNTIAMVGGAPFGVSGAPGLPLTLNPNDTTTFNATFNPSTIGSFTDTLRIGTATIGNVDTAVQGNGVALIPVAIIVDNVHQIVFSFNTTNSTAHNSLDSSTLNNVDMASTLIFNGAIWNDPGNERTLMRLEVFYENYGVVPVTATISAFRPTNANANNFQTATKTVNLGTALADKTERSAFFDIQLSGEIITVQLSRAANGGQVSLIGIFPHWEPKGEKIANT